MYKFAIFLLLFASSTCAMFAQSQRTTQPSESSEQDKGFLSYIDFGGSSNAAGRVFNLGLSAGYEFNRHISVGARMPIYLASPSDATTAATAGSSTGQQNTSSNGIGDPSLAVELNFPNRVLDYQTRLTTWIPVASTTSGFSTGNVLVDWTSRFSRPVGRLIPFGQVDIANTVPDTPTFTLPYTAQGMNTRIEGGANLELTKIFSVGASAYDVLPSGEQHVYSRMVMGGRSGSGSGGSRMTGGAASGNRNGFMMNSVTVGNDLTRDHGFSTWFDASLSKYVDTEIAYTRSYGYDLNTVSFGVGFNLGAALRHHEANQ